MPGFFVSNKKIDVELKNYFPERCLCEKLDTEAITVKRNTLNKFMNDKAFFQNKEFVCVLDGYLLNKKALFEEYSVNSVADLMICMYKQDGDEFFVKFRGGFTGALCDIEKNKWLVFTSHTGENPVYYTEYNGIFAAGCQVNYILDARKALNAPISFDESAAYQMLTYAYMADDSTYANEIKRLRGGTYILFEDGKFSIKTYYTFARHFDRFAGYSEEQIVDEMDKAFRQAVCLEFDKDIEYGYKHLADMSGGMDSRMTVWVAHELNYPQVQLINYGKSDCLDEKISKQVASYWKDELLVKPLDDASFLYDIDEITFLSAGTSLYGGISGGNRLLKSLNMQTFGLEHTGMIGDLVIGSKWNSEKEMNARTIFGLYSYKLVHRLSDKIKNLAHTFEDNEICLHYTRSFQGAVNTYQIRKNYTEVSSPFMNVDLMQLCLDIPTEYRFAHRLYRKWVKKYYPDAAQIIWERTAGKITECKLRTKVRRLFRRGPLKLLSMLGMADRINTGMTPTDHWIATDIKIKTYMDEYEKNGYSYLPDGVSKQLVEDMKWLYKSGNALEKTMVLSVLSASKLYFS